MRKLAQHSQNRWAQNPIITVLGWLHRVSIIIVIVIHIITSSRACTIRTEEVERNDSSVAAVVLDLVWRIEVLDFRMHLAVSPNGCHQLIAYRVVRIFRCCMSNIRKFILKIHIIKQERPLLDGKACKKHLPVPMSIKMANKLQIIVNMLFQYVTSWKQLTCTKLNSLLTDLSIWLCLLMTQIFSLLIVP